MWVVMVQHKTSDQYLTSGKVPTGSIHGFRRYRLLKTFNILSNANADAMVTAIALLYFCTGELKTVVHMVNGVGKNSANLTLSRIRIKSEVAC